MLTRSTARTLSVEVAQPAFTETDISRPEMIQGLSTAVDLAASTASASVEAASDSGRVSGGLTGAYVCATVCGLRV